MGRQVWTGLDGLRAFGVVAVVIFHASLGWAVNGYAGVDVFFALSGFLITWLLLAERQTTGRISLGGFYMRRVLRLYPALVVALVAVSVLAFASDQPAVVLRGVVASLFYVSNWWLYAGHDMPLLEHTWTLAIEEHFYLLWPLLVILAGSARRRGRAVAVVLGVGVVALLALPWPVEIAGVKGTYLRGFSIVLGSVLAVLLYFRPPGDKIIRWLGPLGLLSSMGLVGIMAIPVALPERWMSGLTSVPAWLSLAVIAACVAAPQSPVAQFLSRSPLRWVGKRSYGMYLFHFPLLGLMMHNVSTGLPHVANATIGIVLTVLVTAFSYRFVELPALRLKKRFASHPPAPEHERRRPTAIEV